jgi:hypothetical protein
MAHGVAVGHEQLTVHPVLQLAHVARPGLAVQPVERGFVEAPPRQAVLGAEGFQEMAREQHRVARAFAQRGQAHLKNLQPVHEVGAKVTGLHRHVQRPVGGRDQAHVGAQFARAAQRAVALVLRKAQQHDLRLGAQRIDLVEKQRAAVGLGHQAAARGLGVGEGAALVAEELGLQQVVGQGTAVDGHERPAAACAPGMHGARRQFLAAAGLALDQHRRVARGHAAQLAEHADEAGRGADQGLARHFDAVAGVQLARQGRKKAGLEHAMTRKVDDAVIDWRAIVSRGCLPGQYSISEDRPSVLPISVGS